jgi:hypothetical protein
MQTPPPNEGDITLTPTRHRWRRVSWRALRGLSLLLLFAAAVNGAINYGHREQVCIRCSASCTVNEFYLCGIGGEWGRVVHLGRLAAFIEKHEQAACAHRWVTCSRDSGNALYRSVQFEAVSLDSLYSFMNTTKLDLEKAQERDPTFVEKLKLAIYSPEKESSKPIIDALLADFETFLRDEVLRKP